MSQRTPRAAGLIHEIKVPWPIAIPAALLAVNGEEYLEISRELPQCLHACC